MKNKPKNIPSPYKFSGTKIFRDTTALPFADGGPLHDRNINGKLLNSTYASQLGNMFREGGPFGENKGMFDYATSIYASQPGNYYANGGELGEDPIYSYSGRKDSKYKKDTKGNWLISNKSTGNKFIAIKDPTGSRSQELNKHAKLISTEDSNIQQLFDFGKKSLPQQKIVNKPIENKPFYGDISNAAQPDSFIENITEFADPTGYFSWDDAYRAKQSWDKSGSEYPTINEGLDMFGAVPGLGKLGKLKYLKNADAIKNSMKYVEPAFRIIPWQTILNGVDTGQDVNQDNITFKNGGMIKRADGSYSQRGLWDNIRANAGSGKKPTKEMLAQEKKINREYRTGGQFPTPYSLPEDSFKQGGTNLHNSVYASSSAQYPAVYAEGGTMDTPPNCGPGYYWNGAECIKISESKNLPTYADSLALYKNAIAKGNFYKSKNYTNTGEYSGYSDPKLRQKAIKTLEKYLKKNPKWGTVNKTLVNAFKVDKKYIGKQPFKKVKGTNLTQFGDLIGDTVDDFHNPAAPPILLHPEIAPQAAASYEHKYGDISYIPEYNPLAIKPAKLLSDNEIKTRFKKYGASGIPESRLIRLGLVTEPTKLKQSLPPKPVKKSIPDQVIKPVVKQEPPVVPIKENIVIDKLPIKPAYIDRPKKDIITQTNTTPEEVVEETDVEYTPEYSEEGGPDSVGYHYEDRQKRYIDWNGRAVGYRPLKFRKPGHSGELIKLGGKKYFYLPTIESRTLGWMEADNDNKEEQDTYRNGGMMSRFYASNVPDNNISNKDLTYPENSYVYAQGGDLNNLPMNRYPAASRFLEEGSTASPLTNMMSIPAKTFAYERGGKIYIKPENRGKFTASANRAGMGVQEFASHVLANKDDYSSTQVKRANFAHNAAGWKHANGGHMMAAGGWPPGLKLKQPQLFAAPYYSNATTGLLAPSAEIGLQSKIGKQKGPKGWTIEPHIGYGYNTPEGKFPLSGGIDASYKGLASPDRKGFAVVDMGAGYNPSQGFGAGFGAGYKYRLLGQSNKSRGEIPGGTGSLDIMPYGGWQLGERPKTAQNLNIEGLDSENIQQKVPKWFNSPTYGIKAEGQWRPKLFKNADIQAPLTFFGRADLNFNPNRGQQEQTASYEGMGNQIIDTVDDPNSDNPNQVNLVYGEAPILEQESGLKFKPQFSGVLGVKMPLSRIKEHMPQRKGIPAVEGGEYYNYDEPIEPSIEEKDPTGNWIQNDKGEDVWQYNPGFGDSPNASTIAGEQVVVPTAKFNKLDRKQNPITYDFNTKEFTTPPLPEVEEVYKYGGTMNFKYGGFNNPGFNALPKNVQAKIKARTFNDGGVMPQLTEFNEGGRHEENPLGGIPQGTAGDGRLNLVEEGETKLNAANYIFSDSLKLDKGIAAAFNLPKGDVGKTFSEISKKLNRPNSRRDNDNIEQNAISRDLENLMLAQEAFKQVDLQKDIEMMKTKHPEFMEAMDATMQQQSAQQQGPSPEEMQQMQQGAPQGAPQPGSPEEQAMMENQMMQEQMMAQQQGGMPQGQPMSPEEMAQIPMSYGGSMYMHGGRMHYNNGGHMYGKGGQVLRSIGAGAYGVGEGLLDTLTFGLTDQITDKGYDALAGIGNRDEQDLERDKMIRGFGNTAGAIGGAVVSGGAATGSAISEGFEGAGEGLSNIHGTNKEFDKTVNSLAKIGSIAGGFVGGGAPGGGAGALGGLGGAGGAAGATDAAAQGASQIPQFAETLMKAGQNPFLQQVTGMAGSMMQRNGGYMYPSMYKYGGSFEMPRQQMYMPLDNVERSGGYLFAGGGLMGPGDPPRLNINGKLYTREEALAAAGRGELLADPSEVEGYFADDILMPQGANTTSLPVSDNNIDEIDTDETNVLTQDEEDLANITYPGASGANIITGGKGDYTDMDTLNEEIISAENMVYNSKNSTDKEKAQNYLSALKRLKTDLENKNVDLTMKQTPMQAAGMAAPIAYNLGMGLFSKPTQLKAEDYLNKSRVTPYKVNVDPQLNEARLAYNAAEQGIRNAAPSAGAYLTNRANIAKMRTGSLGEILAKKENTDAQLQMQADAQNAQLEAQNRGTKFAVDDWNAKSKEAKRKYLEKSIEQMGTLAQNAQAMDVQEKYMRLLSPQYGKTFEYQTIFDQLKDYYKNMKSSKENKV